MQVIPMLLVAGLFTSEDYTAWSVGTWDAVPDPLAVPADPAMLAEPAGIEVSLHRVFEMSSRSTSPTGERYSMRLSRDPAGGVTLEDLEVRSLLVSLRSRPALGDKLDLGLMVGSWDEVLAHDKGNRTQWSIHSPVAIHLLGFSRNDMDDEDRMKYYAGLAGGIGGESLTRLVGRVGVHAEGETRIRSVNRWRSGRANATRHELETQLGLGVSWMGADRDWVLDAWGENLLRWDPRDDAGRDGVNLQYDAAGLRLTMRLHPPKQEAEADLDDLLARLREGVASSDPMADLDGLQATPPIALDPEAVLEEMASTSKDTEGSSMETSAEPLLVHWSEPEVVALELPHLPEGMTEEEAECRLRFFVDAEGAPYEIQPEACAPPLLGPAMSAAWQWRMEPFVERGEAHRIQFLYRVRWDAGER